MKINVQHVAKLANLTVTTDEEKKFEKQLSDVLDYVKKLDTLDTTGVTPTSQVTGLENVFREDTTAPSLPQDVALSQAPSTSNGFFEVPGILEQ